MDHHQPHGPPYTHLAAYQYWHSLNMKEWKLDPDPLTSANLLLSKVSVSEGVIPCVEVINIDQNPDYDCLTFSLPEILKDWGCQIKELVTDSSCA